MFQKPIRMAHFPSIDPTVSAHLDATVLYMVLPLEENELAQRLWHLLLKFER